MPRMRPIWSSEAASIAPVGPAETTASAEPSRTSRQAVTIDDPGFARTAAAGSSRESDDVGRLDDLDPLRPVDLGLELRADPAHEHAHAARCGVTGAGDDLGGCVVASHASTATVTVSGSAFTGLLV